MPTEGASPGGNQPPGEKEEDLDVGGLTPVSLGKERKRVVGDVRVRGMLAGTLILIFGLTILAGLLVAALGDTEQTENMRSLLDVLLPAETGLLGSAVGYYYGARGG